MSKFERKYGKYAIKNLTLILIICYAIGYLLELIAPALLGLLYLDVYKIIHQFQVWRLFTWIIVPPGKFDFWTLIMLYFYYSLGTSLEMTWGTYKYNVYLLSGLLFTIIGAFLLYGGTMLLFPVAGPVSQAFSAQYAIMFSTYYINMSIFLAFAATFPNNMVFVLMIIPVRVMYLGIIYAAILVYEFVTCLTRGYVAMCVVILASLLNFIVFFVTQRKQIRKSKRVVNMYSRYQNGSGSSAYSQFGKTNAEKTFSKETKQKSNSQITRHKCAICGKTDVSDPDVQFRFCSKCNGNYEYCENHIFTHKHVE